MLYKELMLKDIEPKLSFSNAKLRIYISSRNETVFSRPGLLVLPGGGYSYCSPREAEPIAFRFLSEGFNCFILDYTPNKKYPSPHLEVAAAFNFIRQHEKEFDLIPHCLSVIGFSAGGHLAASYGYLYPEFAKELGFDVNSIRPFSLVLSYPVTIFNEYTHKGTMETICGHDEFLKEKLSVPNNVTKEYPPTFIWATEDDEMVPSINSKMLDEALTNHHVTHKCVIYESGRHGLSMDNRSVYLEQDITTKMKEVRDWASLAADFIFEIIDNEN